MVWCSDHNFQNKKKYGLRDPVSDKEREIDPTDDRERERGREIRHPRIPVGDRERERKREQAGIRGIPAGSLSISGHRERPSVGFGWKPRRPHQIQPETHTHWHGFEKSGTPSPALSPIVPFMSSQSPCSVPIPQLLSCFSFFFFEMLLNYI
jgi:hypothetical protein